MSKRASRKLAKKKAAPKPSRDVLRGSRLGDALKVVYRHSNGKLYQHKFKKGAALGALEGGRYLVIGPVEVLKFIV